MLKKFFFLTFALLVGCSLRTATAQAAPIEDAAPVVSTSSLNNLIRVAAEAPSPIARENAQKSIVGMGPDSIAGLEKALKEGTDPVRAMAVQMLGDLGDPKTVPALILAAQTDSSRVVRGRALKALDHIPNAHATPVFILALRMDKDPNVRATAADALGRSTEPDAVSALIEALADPDDEVSNAAIEALASMRPARTDELIKVLKDKRPAVRAHAAEALGSTEDPAAVPHLIKLLHDDDAMVRRAAAASLGELNDAQAIPHLQDALKSEKDPGVQQALHDALAALGR